MDLRKLFSARKARLGALSGGGVLLLASVLSLANLLSRHFFLRLDMTEGGRYSLSKASRRLVGGLPDPVLFRAYISQGLPQPYETQARYLVDLLGEYKAAGRGRVKLEVLNPESSEKVQGDARKAGITPARFTQVASDQFQIREGYLGLVMFYQDKQEVLPFVKTSDGLEYEVTTRLKKMAQKEKKILGMVTGQGERAPESLRNGPAAKLFDAFDVRLVELSTKTAFKPDLLFVAGPGTPFKPEELAMLDGFVAGGTPVAVFLSKKTVSLRNFSLTPRPAVLDDWLLHYGVRVGEDLVFDLQCQQVSFQPREGGMTNVINYPAFILARADKALPLAKSLDALGFPYAHPLLPAGGGGPRFTPLARSSPYSWIPSNLSSVDPYALRPPAPEEVRGPFTLAALVEGSTVSFHDPAAQARVRMAVIGTDYFLDDALPAPPGNSDFLSSLAEWMLQDKEVLSIPSRGAAFRPLRPAPPFVRGLVKIMGYFFLPVLVVALGLLRWRRRRFSRLRIEKEWREALGA